MRTAFYQRFSRNFRRRVLKPLLEFALPAGERLAGFETARGDYLPSRIRMLLGRYESEERKLMRAFLRPGQTIVDVGANIGYLTRFFADATGVNGQVYAFEPNPLIFPILERNIAPFPQVSAMNCGLSTEQAESLLFLAGNDHSVGAFSAEYPSIHVQYQDAGKLHSVRAQLISGDQFFGERGIDNIHVLKIDVEGWEPNVLRGLEGTISRSPEIVIFCEYNRAAQECAGHLPDELLNWFFGHGFTVAVPKDRVLSQLFRSDVSKWIDQLPPGGYTTLFASRGPGHFPSR